VTQKAICPLARQHTANHGPEGHKLNKKKRFVAPHQSNRKPAQETKDAEVPRAGQTLLPQIRRSGPSIWITWPCPHSIRFSQAIEGTDFGVI